MSSQYTADRIAAYFILKCQAYGDFISNLRLQKLLYYAQAWHLAIFDVPLFDDEFEAWENGPRIPSVYKQYEKYSTLPIQYPSHLSFPDFNKELNDFFEEFIDEYWQCSGWELMQMLYKETPWLEVRENIVNKDTNINLITKSAIKNYFKTLL